MKKIAIASALLAGIVATPAAAQVSGQVNITGFVTSKCFVAPGGSGSGTIPTTTVALGDLANADGTLRTDLRSTTTPSLTVAAQVVCTGVDPKVSVLASPLDVATPGAPTGYDDVIDFDATLTVKRAGASDVLTTDASTDSVATTGTVIGRIANAANNLVITAANFRTNNLTDLLVADSNYTGTIVVTVAP